MKIILIGIILITTFGGSFTQDGQNVGQKSGPDVPRGPGGKDIKNGNSSQVEQIGQGNIEQLVRPSGQGGPKVQNGQIGSNGPSGQIGHVPNLMQGGLRGLGGGDRGISGGQVSQNGGRGVFGGQGGQAGQNEGREMLVGRGGQNGGWGIPGGQVGQRGQNGQRGMLIGQDWPGGQNGGWRTSRGQNGQGGQNGGWGTSGGQNGQRGMLVGQGWPSGQNGGWRTPRGQNGQSGQNRAQDGQGFGMQGDLEKRLGFQISKQKVMAVPAMYLGKEAQVQKWVSPGVFVGKEGQYIINKEGQLQKLVSPVVFVNKEVEVQKQIIPPKVMYAGVRKGQAQGQDRSEGVTSGQAVI